MHVPPDQVKNLRVSASPILRWRRWGPPRAWPVHAKAGALTACAARGRRRGRAGVRRVPGPDARRVRGPAGQAAVPRRAQAPGAARRERLSSRRGGWGGGLQVGQELGPSGLVRAGAVEARARTGHSV